MANYEFNIEGHDETFRIKRMNAIEAVALRTVIDFSDFAQTIETIDVVLEHVEVLCEEKWLPVKSKGVNVLLPAYLDDDPMSVNAIVKYFLNDYLKPLFQRSDESKQKTE